MACGVASLELQEIRKHLLARIREDGFGVELDAFDRMTLVTKAHNKVAAARVRAGGGDLQAVGQSVGLDDQGMVTRGGERVGETLKNGPAIVGDLAGLAVHDFRRKPHLAAEGLPEALVAQADAENRQTAGEFADQLQADARLRRRLRPRRDDDALGPEGFDLV